MKKIITSVLSTILALPAVFATGAWNKTDACGFYGSKGGSFAEVDGQLPYEVGYKDEYSCRMIIKYYSTRGNIETYYETILDGCYPTVIGDGA